MIWQHRRNTTFKSGVYILFVKAKTAMPVPHCYFGKEKGKAIIYFPYIFDENPSPEYGGK